MEGIQVVNYRGHRITAEQFKHGWTVSWVEDGHYLSSDFWPSAKAAIHYAKRQIDRAMSKPTLERRCLFNR